MPFFAWLMFRLTSHWKQFRISGSQLAAFDFAVREAHSDSSANRLDLPGSQPFGGRHRIHDDRVVIDGDVGQTDHFQVRREAVFMPAGNGWEAIIVGLVEI